ncbi:MAG TPA: DUF58 domain-containing protein [Verrucomicrobiales bacterium]|nr:DUF58 domain-containing protein [Verrucomicrobiales bacterium]
MISTDADELFDSKLLKRLESLSLATRHLVKGKQRSERRSHQRGSSIEFAEYRPFVTGDDWRYIDWNAFARWRQLVLKLFIEEEDLYVHLLLDSSASMDFGHPVKFDYSRQIAAGLAFLALANLDRVAVIPMGSEGWLEWQPARGRHRFLPLLRYLARCPISQSTVSMKKLMSSWCASKPKRGLTIWISDLWGSDLKDALQALDRLRYSKQEIAVIQIMDPTESEAGEVGEYELSDCETNERRKVIVDAALIREYRRRHSSYQEEIQRYCHRYQISLIQADTRVSVPDLLMKSLMKGGFVR